MSMRDIPGLDLDRYDHVLDTRAEDWQRVRALAETRQVNEKAWRKLRAELGRWAPDDEDLIRVVLPFVRHRTQRWISFMPSYHYTQALGSLGVISLKPEARWVKSLATDTPMPHMLLIDELEDTSFDPALLPRALGTPYSANIKRLIIHREGVKVGTIRAALRDARLPALQELFVRGQVPGIIQTLGEVGLLQQLVKLDLRSCSLCDEDVLALIEHSPEALVRLELYGNPDLSVSALAQLDTRAEACLPRLQGPSNFSGTFPWAQLGNPATGRRAFNGTPAYYDDDDDDYYSDSYE